MIIVKNKIFNSIWHPFKRDYLITISPLIAPSLLTETTDSNNSMAELILWLIIVCLILLSGRLFLSNRKKTINQETIHGSFLDGTLKNDNLAGEFQRSILLRNALASAEAGYWEGNFILNKANASSKLYEIFGLLPDSEFIYETGTRIIHPDDNERVHIEISSRLMHHQQPIKYEYKIITPQGKIKYIEAYTQIIIDDNKNATGMFGIIKDISHHKMLEYSLFDNDDYEQTLTDCVKLTPVPFNFAMMIDDIRFLLSPFALKKNIIFTIEQPELIIPILDEPHLKQVMMCLTNNAINFTKRGEVKISISVELEPDLNIGELTIIISDTGCGIAPEKVDILFDFNKAIKPKEKQPLSLIFAQQTIFAMGGNITVTSILGKGSNFTIHLPHVSFIQPRGKIIKQVKKRSVYFEPAMVLIAGNTTYEQKMLAFILLRMGLYPVPVTSAKEALEKIAEPDSNIALTIINTGMQDINLTTVKKLYRNGKKSAIPLVAILAKTEDGERFSSDFAAILAPPFGSLQLANVLQNFLPSQFY